MKKTLCSKVVTKFIFYTFQKYISCDKFYIYFHFANGFRKFSIEKCYKYACLFCDDDMLHVVGILFMQFIRYLERKQGLFLC